MSVATQVTLEMVVWRFTPALGPAVSTPEWITDGRGGLRRATYRVWRWDCPICRAGEDDPDHIYRPLVIDTDGRVSCDECHATPEAIGREIVLQCDVQSLLEALEIV